MGTLDESQYRKAAALASQAEKATRAIPSAGPEGYPQFKKPNPALVPRQWTASMPENVQNRRQYLDDAVRQRVERAELGLSDTDAEQKAYKEQNPSANEVISRHLAHQAQNPSADEVIARHHARRDEAVRAEKHKGAAYLPADQYKAPPLAPHNLRKERDAAEAKAARDLSAISTSKPTSPPSKGNTAAVKEAFKASNRRP